MAIVYRCKNCGKKFKVRDYIQLEVVRVDDDIYARVLASQGRKCDSCGKEISAEDKIVEM